MKHLLFALFISTAGMAFASDIVLSKKINPEIATKMQRDLDVLDQFQFQKASPNTLKLMELQSFDTDSIKLWLGERVNYIIEEDALSFLKLLVKRVVYVERKDVVFPNQSVLPYSLNPMPVVEKKDNDEDQEEGVVAMSNIGAGLYTNGKQEGKVYGMRIPRGFLKRSIMLTVESPRIGIIQVGEGLFQRSKTINNQNLNSVANSLNRLIALFHEARHSDGNGESLGFAHAKCPEGHDLEGEYACDENLNGPYSIGAAVALEMIKSCGDNCTEREKETLKLVALDSQSRVMTITHKDTRATNWDTTPESL